MIVHFLKIIYLIKPGNAKYLFVTLILEDWLTLIYILQLASVFCESFSKKKREEDQFCVCELPENVIL